MKKLTIFVLFVLFASTTVLAKKVEIDTYITATNVKDKDGNPCRFHVTGTATFSILKMELTSYNITMSGPCGTYHFEGSIGPKYVINSGTLLNAKNEPISIDENPWINDVIKILEDEYLKEEYDKPRE